MIPVDKCKQIAAGLLEKSRSGELRWTFFTPNEFKLRLTHSQIAIRQVSPPTEPDYLELLISDFQGTPIGKVQVYQEEPGWSELSDLFYEAQRNSGYLGPILAELDTLIKTT